MVRSVALCRADTTTSPFMRGSSIVPETANRKTQRQEDSTLDAYYELRKEEDTA